jgi:hypothetical protein
MIVILTCFKTLKIVAIYILTLDCRVKRQEAVTKLES